ncbi:winged helix-turn-helix transcriptional regulator [Geodermatophilus ruber]|uniref:winged helix-turn-helix transcriptional regulator n=1 Tax=Geodermatophilus ruber TaxID=504800 RepID=UPI003CCBA399
MRRDRLIVEAAEQGASLREIASAVGLSNPGVLRVLRRLEAHHIAPRSERDVENDLDNLEVLTTNEHRLRHSSQPES